MNLVLTVCNGEGYQKLAEFTHPMIKAYAEKIGAEFLCIKENKIAETTIHWEKFQIEELLNSYERILYLDTDIIIREDCPNLFDIVPKNMIGMFNEAPFVSRSKELMIDTCKAYDVKLPTWNGKYFNTGVMVVPRIYKDLFKKPDLEYCSFYEQSYFNMLLAEKNIDVFELEYRFNRMTCLDSFTGEERFASYIVHYAGCPSIVTILDLIPKDLLKWKNAKGNFKYKKNIYVCVSGGLGDQICAEPSIRFMKDHVYPNDNIVVTTHYPKLFRHLNVPVFEQGKFIPENDTPYYITNSLPPPESLTWMVVSNLLCHTVDYCSIALMKRTLPVSYKQMKIEVDQRDADNVKSIAKSPLEDLIVIHAGRHWHSKTFPDIYWQGIIDGLSKHHKVCLIGTDNETRGTVNVKCPDNGVDLRNLLSLEESIALISKAKILLSNDSAPIHMAGAFDNWIVLIPSCKHPDHVLPYRNNGNPYHKALALYKKLPCDEFNAQPTTVHGSSAEFTLGNWDNYLLPVEEVVEKVRGLWWLP